MPEWLVERGIGETRAALVDDSEIIEALIELEGPIPAGSVIRARLVSTGTSGRNAVAVSDGGREFLLPRGAAGVAQGGTLSIEITRAAIPGPEPWKRALGKVSEREPSAAPDLAERLGARELIFPGGRDELGKAGWNDLVDQARTGFVAFAGGELRISATPAMTLIDVDGHLDPNDLSILGAAEAARTIRRLDIGGSIGIDLPTASNKAARQSSASAIDTILPQPFERTAVNGFGFVQIVRRRARASIIELALDRPAFEARALLRSAAFEQGGSKRVVANPAVIAVLEKHRVWLEQLSRQLGGSIGLRVDAELPMSGGYVENP